MALCDKTLLCVTVCVLCAREEHTKQTQNTTVPVNQTKSNMAGDAAKKLLNQNKATMSKYRLIILAVNVRVPTSPLPPPCR